MADSDNLNSLAGMLRNMPDEALQQEMQNPSGSVPQFLIMSEMQRRQKMRSATMASPPPTTTVAQDAGFTSGIAASPQMAAGGVPDFKGIAKFAGGGAVDDYMDQNTQDFQNRGSKIKKYFSDRFMQLSDLVPSQLSPEETQRRLAQDGADPKLEKPVFAPPTSYGNPAPNNTISPSLQGDGASFTDAAKKMIANIPPNYDSYAQGDMLPTGLGTPAKAAATPPANQPPPPPAAKKQGIAAARRPAAAPVAASAPAPQEEPVDEEDDTDVADNGAPERPDMQDYPDLPEHQDFDSYLSKVQQNFPDQYGALIDKANARQGDIDKMGSRNLGMSLMQAGLGMTAAAAKGGTTMGALAQGGIGGLGAFAKGQNDINTRKEAMAQHLERLSMAQEQARQGNWKTAAEMKKAEDSQAQQQYANEFGATQHQNQEALTGYRYDNDQYKTDQRTKQMIAAEDARANRQASHEDFLRGIEGMKEGGRNSRAGASNATRLQTASMRASGSSGSKEEKANNAAADKLDKYTQQELKKGEVKDSFGQKKQTVTEDQARAKGYARLSAAQKKRAGAPPAAAAPAASTTTRGPTPFSDFQ